MRGGEGRKGKTNGEKWTRKRKESGDREESNDGDGVNGDERKDKCREKRKLEGDRQGREG